MDPLTSAAASGIQARMDSIDMLANNMSNGSTTGFKVDREFYSTFAGNSPSAGLDPSVADEPVVERRWTDFSQGALVPTGSPTDLALSGNGFFAANGPNGTLYTRNGNFRLSPTGTLITSEGYSVRGVGGGAIQLAGTGPIEVSAQGEIRQDRQSVGQLELTSFAEPNMLSKAAATYYENTDPKQNPSSVAANVQVSQARLESSNSQPAESAARMVSLLRHFEMLQHAVKIGTEMNRQAIEEVARVTS